MASWYTAALSQATTLTTSSAETTIVTADAGFRNDLTGLAITVLTAGAIGTLTIRNTTGGSAVIVIDCPATAVVPTSGPVQLQFTVPLQGAAPNANWTIQSSSASNSFKVNAFYVKGV